MTINNEKSGELFEKYDYKNYDEDDDDYEIDEDDEEDEDEDIDEYADGTISNSNTSSSERSSSKSKNKKKIKTGLDQNLSPDEGVGDSAEMCPPPSSSTTTGHKKKGMILASLRPDSNNTEADAYSQVITFKRSQPPGAKTRTNLGNDEYSSVNEITTQSNRSNMRFFRRLAGFFPNKSIAPKRQQSQTSTGTTSSYLSSNYSSGDAEDLSVRRSTVDHHPSVDALLLVNFEERQLLIPPVAQQTQRSNSSSSNESASMSPYESTVAQRDSSSMMIHSINAPNSIYNNNLSKILRTSSARNRDSDNTNSGNIYNRS